MLPALLAAVAASSLLWVSTSHARTESLDDLVNAFVEIVDRAEYKVEKSGRVIGATKWIRPIKFNVIGATSEELIGEAESHMKLLAQLSSHPIERKFAFTVTANGQRERVDERHTLSDDFDFGTMREDIQERGTLVNALTDKTSSRGIAWLGNFSIIFGKRRQLERVFEHLPFNASTRAEFSNGTIWCFGAELFPEGSRDPRLAVILIPTDQERKLLRRCLVEETTQALGLINDIPGSTLTLFDDRPDRRRTELTVYDKMFLKVLYSPEIRIGMTGPELRSVARRLISAELKASP